MAESVLAAAFATAYLGFALLALSLPRHWRDVTGNSSPSARQRVVFRLTGYAALPLAFALVLRQEGAAFGSVLGILLLSASAAAVALTLSWRPGALAVLVNTGARRAPPKKRVR